ncbi:MULTISPECIES: hypothetical protein [Clostridium]|uniref:hypothetical protein n=1 Tax=Clostridium TaxID=1485 RepID=UPI0008250DF6|nr:MULTISPECIES: hypothetical protein [Clostridium]PJI07350.1 hypothetical protein CUB90_05500 [Clostridium sp. CT7]
MDENKIVNKFLEQKENENKSLEEKIIMLEDSIEKMNKENKEYEKILEKERLKNAILNNRYGMLLGEAKEKGIVFKIRNSNLNIREWDNLYFKDQKGIIYIQSFSGNLIHEFDENVSGLIRILISENEYSLIVIRMNEKNIKIQFRIVEKTSDNK